MHKFIVGIWVPIIFLAACVSESAIEPQKANVSVSLNAEEQRIYEQLQFFVDAREIRSDAQRVFFAREAAAAGVTTVRVMTEAEKPKRLAGAQTGCGQTRGKTILVDGDRRECIFIGNLAHEAAHFLAYRERCFGHGDRFYRINYQMAERFEKQFPGVKWGGRRPTGDVVNRSKEYRNGEQGCPGNVDIRTGLPT